MEHRQLVVRLTEDQFKILDAKARSAGFFQRSDYVRTVLFMPLPMEEKINEMHGILKKWSQNGN